MKTASACAASRLGPRFAALCTVLLGLAGASAIAGPLDPPPGPVAPTGKTLAEIEPRTAINATNTPGDATCSYRITQPGSYYFTGNIVGVAGKNGIKISLGPSGGSVSISMKGFTLRGVPGSLDAIVWDLDNDGIIATWDLNNDGSFGVIENWGGSAINSRVPGRIQGIATVYTFGPCIKLSSTANRATTLEGCTLRTNSGPALVTDSASPVVLRNCTVEASGCNTTSLISLGADAEIAGLRVSVRDSAFSGPIMDVAGTASLTHSTDGGIMSVSTVSAASAMRIAPGARGIVKYEWDFNFTGGTFSSALIDIARDNSDIRRVHIRTDAETSAPVGGRITAINTAIDEGLWWFHLSPIPVGMDISGSNNTVQHTKITTAGVGIRINGAANTLTDCRIVGSGANGIIGVLIALGSTNNLVSGNEFVRFSAGTPVSNLGGATNGVGPIATPATMATATSPFSNIQH
ncbi:MAG: hypothetical protein JSR77_17095 [Planctomycetes bacterium]|nr:hypothetical protein [Planctomycetota bacterium]